MKIFKCCMALAVFFMAVASSSAQDRLNPKVGDTIVLKSYCQVQNTGSFLNNGTKTLANQNTFLQYLEPNVKYMINAINDQTVDLVALDYQPLSAKKLQEMQKTKTEAFDKSLYYNGKIYKILRSEFNDSAVRKPKEDTILSIGLLTLPFKARPQNDFSFDTEFNINTTLNVRVYEFKKIKTSLNWQFGT